MLRLYGCGYFVNSPLVIDANLGKKITLYESDRRVQLKCNFQPKKSVREAYCLSGAGSSRRYIQSACRYTLDLAVDISAIQAQDSGSGTAPPWRAAAVPATSCGSCPDIRGREQQDDNSISGHFDFRPPNRAARIPAANPQTWPSQETCVAVGSIPQKRPP